MVMFDEDAILDATVAALARASTTSMQDIATSAGVPKTTLHDRYGGRPGLVERAVARERRRLAEHLVTSYRDARDDLRPGSQIRRGYTALFSWARSNPDSFRLLFGGDAQGETVHHEARREVVDQIAEIVGERFAAAGLALGVSREIIAAVIVGAGESVARIVAADATIDIDAVTELVAGVISNGLSNIDVDAIGAVDRAPRPGPTTRPARS